MSSEPNLELCFLEYNGRQKVFAPQKSLSVKKVGKSPKPIPDSGTISPICNCETSEIIPFVGDPVHSRINLSVRALSQQGYINTLAVLDSGSEVNVIIDGFLRENGLNWDINTNKSRPNQKVSFSGPSGDCLKFKGDIKLWVKIKDKTELTPFVILEGDSPTIILGNPGMNVGFLFQLLPQFLVFPAVLFVQGVGDLLPLLHLLLQRQHQTVQKST